MTEQPTPCEVVFDYARDVVMFDGTDLPFPLSGIQARAVAEDGHTVVTLTLDVDQVRTVAALPNKPDAPEDTPPAPGPEQQFENQLDRIRNGARRG
ncbi:hypothetical protein PBI_BLUEBERRY_13 [Gordonia phage Blueberry]|uniref:Uncharacterized protein n=1 Tax=Gordonia phage Azula TaxID=2762397 RepID=A0A7G8LKQ2_9CAUD|nr:head-tail connector protein [Gordonia phage Blueberry]YP_010109939.1 head-tail connector protein [Gordonia phage Azula]QGJ97385.1 hypothetical protein SEA_GAMBINO_13 [Gordonia phage Gambino]QZD97445.1 hypothetical protein SEA_MISSRONA_13 [Gordonia phage MissRona]ANA85475.1 hypothetical protein PBI_BLUEBERRY_13 [Gordonia phage Blueberry]QNJ57824.1 hypothetical protein SEA_AZULA_13 [Gordonia phage Azula]